MALAPWLCLLCDSVPTPKKHAHMLHLSLASERQKEWVIMLRKKDSPFQGSCLQTSQAYTSNTFGTYI